jgi:NAD(P)-dependent dehydrogenase (short-subunit alcohol dehydrogenase family)
METEVAVVTCGAGGLGQLITQRLAQRDLSLLSPTSIVMRPRSSQRNSRARQPRLIHRDRRFQCRDIRRLMAEVASLGVLKILINNSGGWLAGCQFPSRIMAPLPRSEPTHADAGRSACGSADEQPRGTIVNISSSAGLASQAYGSPEYGVRRPDSFASRRPLRTGSSATTFVLTAWCRTGSASPEPFENLSR